MAVVDTPLTVPSKNFESDQKQHRANMKEIENFAQTIFTQLVPVGSILAYTGISPPSGWLYCNGAAVRRDTYSTLYAVIGTVYGAGDGSTTFNLPKLDANSATDMRVPVGAGIGVSLGTTTGTILSNAATTQGKGTAVNFIIKT